MPSESSELLDLDNLKVFSNREIQIQRVDTIPNVESNFALHVVLRTVA
jgi:hypothetical protein